MGHPEIDNQTPFVFEPLFLADEEMRPIVVTLVKATFDIGSEGEVELAEEQRPFCAEGEPYGEAGESSYRLEPETAFEKPATDVVLVGHAHAPAGGVAQMQIKIRCRITNIEHDQLVTGQADGVVVRRIAGAK